VGSPEGTEALERNLAAGVTATGLSVTRVGDALATGVDAVIA